jgi:hypothetical protein
MELIWITSAKHLNDYNLQLEFNTGEIKNVNLEQYLNRPVFLPLKDKDYFKSFRLNPFTIEWENGADFAPEFLYQIGKVG